MNGLGAEIALGKGDCFAVDNGLVEYLLWVGKVAVAETVLGRVAFNFVPGFEQTTRSGSHFGNLFGRQQIFYNRVAALLQFSKNGICKFFFCHIKFLEPHFAFERFYLCGSIRSRLASLPTARGAFRKKRASRRFLCATPP